MNDPLWESTESRHGRRYYRIKEGLYDLPQDEQEKKRLDTFHNLWHNRDDIGRLRGPLRLVNSPLKHKARVLDLGFGSGIWTMEVAAEHETAQVYAIDIVRMQPVAVHSNAHFIAPYDFNEPIWAFATSPFDLVHLAFSHSSRVLWDSLYSNIYKSLTPSTGFFEQCEMDWQPRCDDGSLNPSSIVYEWFNLLRDTSSRSGLPIAYTPNAIPDGLRKARFEIVDHRVIRVPWHCWRNSEADPVGWHMGVFFQYAMVEDGGIEALTMAPFSRILRWSEQQIRDYCAQVCKVLRNNDHHVYSEAHFWQARRPS